MFAKPWYFFILNLARFAFFLLGGMRSKGTVPKSGALIVAPIHVSHLDPPAVACGCNRMLRFMAKEELFRGFFGWLIESVGAFRVKRGESDTESIRLAMKFLEQGQAVLIFPEGTRGDGKRIRPLEKGVALIAKRTGAPVMPVAVIGTHIALPRDQSKPRRSRIKIVYGEPFTFAQVAGEGKGDRERFLDALAERLRVLCAAEGLSLEPPLKEPAP